MPTISLHALVTSGAQTFCTNILTSYAQTDILLPNFGGSPIQGESPIIGESDDGPQVAISQVLADHNILTSSDLRCYYYLDRRIFTVQSERGITRSSITVVGEIATNTLQFPEIPAPVVFTSRTRLFDQAITLSTTNIWSPVGSGTPPTPAPVAAPAVAQPSNTMSGSTDVKSLAAATLLPTRPPVLLPLNTPSPSIKAQDSSNVDSLKRPAGDSAESKHTLDFLSVPPLVDVALTSEVKQQGNQEIPQSNNAGFPSSSTKSGFKPLESSVAEEDPAFTTVLQRTLDGGHSQIQSRSSEGRRPAFPAVIISSSTLTTLTEITSNTPAQSRLVGSSLAVIAAGSMLATAAVGSSLIDDSTAAREDLLTMKSGGAVGSIAIAATAVSVDAVSFVPGTSRKPLISIEPSVLINQPTPSTDLTLSGPYQPDNSATSEGIAQPAAAGYGILVLGSQTLVPGAATATVSGMAISLEASGSAVIINGRTEVLQPVTQAGGTSNSMVFSLLGGGLVQPSSVETPTQKPNDSITTAGTAPVRGRLVAVMAFKMALLATTMIQI